MRFFVLAVGAQNLLLIGRDLVVAYIWGTTEPLADLMSAMIVPIMLMSLLGNSIAAALLPVYLHQKKSSSPQVLRMYAQRILSSTAILFSATFLVRLVWSWNEPHSVGMSLYGLLFALASVPRTFLIAENQDRAVLIAPVIALASGIAWLALTYPVFNVGALESGYIASAAVELLALLGFVQRRVFTLSPFRLKFYSKEFNGLRNQLGWVAGNSLLMSVTLMLDQTIARSLGASTLVHYNYALKITSMFLSLATALLTLYVLPRLTTAIAHDQPALAKARLIKYIGTTLVIVLPVSLLFSAYSGTLASLLFERGAFLAADSFAVGMAQRYFLLQLPSHFIMLLSTQVLLAHQQARWVFASGLLIVIVRPLLSWNLVSHVGLPGVGIAAATVHFLTAVGLTVCAFWYLKRSLAGAAISNPALRQAN